MESQSACTQDAILYRGGSILQQCNEVLKAISAVWRKGNALGVSWRESAH